PHTPRPPPFHPHGGALGGAPPQDQGDRPAPRRDQLPGPGLGGPGPCQRWLARPHDDPQGATAAEKPPPPTGAPNRRRGGDQPGCHRRRVTSPRSLRPEPFTPLLGRHHDGRTLPEEYSGVEADQALRKSARER